MTHDELLAHCLDLPGAWPDEPWEAQVVVKVGRPGKIFAFPGDGGEAAVSLKVRPEDRDELTGSYPGTVTDAPYLSKRHWVRIRLDGPVPDDELRDLLDTSHALVVAGLPVAQRPTP